MSTSRHTPAVFIRHLALWVTVLSLSNGTLPLRGEDPPARPPVGETARVERRTLSRKIYLSGEIQAVRAATVHAPATRAWGLLLSWIAPDGTRVEAGEVVARFDVSRLQLDRLDLEKAREEARVRIAQKEADIESRRQDLLLRQAAARKTLEIARLYADIDRALLPRSEAERYAHDLENATLELKKIDESVAGLERTARDELEVTRLAFEEADLSLKQILNEIESMTLRAPASGQVMVRRNPESARPYQVGDKLFNGRPVLSLPDLGALRVEAEVHDPDILDLRPGLPTRVTLDAAPDRGFDGRIGFIAEASRNPESGSLLKQFRVNVDLPGVTDARMKPGMTARVEVTVNRMALAVPRAAVRVSAAGVTCVVDGDGKEIPVKVTEADDRFAAVEGNLREGGDVRLIAGSSAAGGPAAVEWVDVKRQDIRFTVSGSGAIQAEKSANVGPPPLPQVWEYKIVRMADEGSPVKPGDFLLQFDPSEILRRLQDEQADLEKASREIQRVRAAGELKMRDLGMELEDAKVQKERTAGKLKDASLVESAIKVKEAEFEAAFAARRVGLLEDKLAFSRKSAEFEQQLLREAENFHRERVRSYQAALQALTIFAPVGGVVLYGSGWRGDKKKIGDTVWLMENIVFIPDLTTLMVKGEIAEADSGKVRLGQAVSVNFDAIPERVFPGRITRVAGTFSQSTPDLPVKVLEVGIRLDTVDPLRMRPGMVARLEIVHDLFRNVLAVPLASIQEEGGHSYLWVQQDGKPVRREVRVGRNNGIIAIVTEGLRDGDRVADRPVRP